MDKGLFIAMTGAKHNALGQALLANNLANANTAGFKEDFAQARAMGVYYGDGQPTRAYSMAERPGTNLDHGSMIETGRDLDIAVDGNGWIAVRGKDGKEAYTRAGNLKIDSLGQLTTGNGLPVLGSGGPISIPAAEKVEILSDGTINVRELGQAASLVTPVDQIKLVKPDNAQLEKGEDGLMRVKGGTPAAADPTVRVAGGFIESSNVNAVEAMTQIMSLARQYELNVKLMKSMDENSAASARVLQNLG